VSTLASNPRTIVPAQPTPGLVASGLPSPPSDEEKYWYMGRQHRWLLYVQALSFTAISYSVLRFAVSDMRLLLFLIPMSLYVVTLLVSLISTSRGKRTSRADHDRRVGAYRPASYPGVDVFLPSAGEPLDVLANTYHHVAALSWPGDLIVYVLDDAASPEVRDLAEAHGFVYGTRPDRGFLKKAGNLRYGYEGSSGDIIAIFDADFAPRTDFLRELVPYFEQADVAIVQSPQFFDTDKQMSWLQRNAGATQELFYRWVQPARDRSGAAICVGSCAIYRRSALERAGGFAQIGHSEDVHTGVNLMKVGYKVRYVPILVSKGLCPDTSKGFLNQQYRWCTGSMSLLADQAFHDNDHISPRQRLCYWAGFLYYISTALNAFTAILPALAMLYLHPDYVWPRNSIYLLGGLAMWTLILPAMFKGRWRLSVLRVTTLYSFAHAVAIVHLLTGRTKEWVATGTANSSRSTPLATTVLRTTKSWVVLTQGALAYGIYRGITVYGIEHLWAMLIFAVLAAYVQLPLLFLRNPSAKRNSGAGASAPATLDYVELGPRGRHLRTVATDGVAQ
jgi:cellulose synthase/poly-beta-1,6-N-acetylglucosamine synthase-like glycosyltransferase